jgi:thymidine phosphorylase
LSDEIDPAVGVVCLREAGSRVDVGDDLFLIHHRDGRGLEEARAHLARGVEVGDAAGVSPLVLRRID